MTPENLRKLNKEIHSDKFNKDVLSHLLHDLNGFLHGAKMFLEAHPDAKHLEHVLDMYEKKIYKKWVPFLDQEWKITLEQYKNKVDFNELV